MLSSDDAGNHIFAACKHSVKEAARRAFEVCPAAAWPPVCTHSVRAQRLIFQSFWLGWFALIAGAVYRCMLAWGLTGLRSPSDELRSEGNIQHSCAYSEGRGQGRGRGQGQGRGRGWEKHAATLPGTGAPPASEAIHQEPVCIYKNVCSCPEMRISPMALEWDGKERNWAGSW